ncbi:nuclear transport factor 2 family protein [bacterium]|nr:MAG: nuclear transport factor 2 family protein [bacterium]
MKSLAVVISLSAVLCNASAQSLRSQIDAANKTSSRLMMAKDVKGLTKHWKAGMTPDFKYVEGGKTQNFDAMAAGMAMGLGQMNKLSKAESKLLTLKEKGNTATATTRHTMGFTGVSSDTYVKQGGKWRMSKMSWLKQTSSMDGKPMPGM